MTGKPNHLVSEKSPYLLQHAHNPVHWYPWGDEAFAKAKRENKPIFLSIGYSTCHWCHVMERESFEDEEVAALLNESFVSIKVDREERPDVDHLYMSVCQALTGSGGWPLTVLITPDQKPFFAGTYFPKKRMMGRPGLMDLLSQIREVWRENRDEIENTGEQLQAALSTNSLPATEGEFGEKPVHQAYESFTRLFDGQYGGFGGAPKFPSPHNLLFLFRYAAQFEQPHAADMALITLDRIAQGGIRDHVGGGFARYSTDALWLVPHFEKMLYDNALLLMAYTEAWLVAGKPEHAEAAEEIVTYVLRDMTGPDGEFYSAEDADTEGVEGKFYVWTPDEIAAILGESDSRIYNALYGITEDGNFEDANIPNLLQGMLPARATEFGMTPDQLSDRAQDWNARLLAKRNERPRPYRDDKVLTAWNGLMIAALAKASAAFERPEWAEAAGRAARFLHSRLVREDGRLLARYREGEAAHLAYLDDYACLVWGLTEMFQATLQPEYLRDARRWAEEAIRLFRDKEGGAFSFTGDDAERLLVRPKETYDGAMPSGNSVLTYVLLRLTSFTGEESYRRHGLSALNELSGAAQRSPTGHSMLMCAALLALSGGREVVLAGDAENAELRGMLAALRRLYLPDTAVLLVTSDTAEQLAEANPLLADKHSIDGRATAYVCQTFACRQPVHTLEHLLQQLEKNTKKASP